MGYAWKQNRLIREPSESAVGQLRVDEPGPWRGETEKVENHVSDWRERNL